jgi:hypothetical protein
MNNGDRKQSDFFGTLDSGALDAAGSQPVGPGQRPKSARKVRPKKPKNSSAGTKHPFQNPIQPAPVSDAEAQRIRREKKENAGLCRVETWLPLQAKTRLKEEAESQKMNAQEFLKKLITENLTSK